VVWAPVALAAPAATRVRLWAGFGFARGRRPRLRKCRVGPPGCRGQGTQSYKECGVQGGLEGAHRRQSPPDQLRPAEWGSDSTADRELRQVPSTRGWTEFAKLRPQRPPDTPATGYRHTPATGYRLSTGLTPESRARENPPEGVVPAYHPSKQIRPRAESKTRRKRRWATGAPLGDRGAVGNGKRRRVREMPLHEPRRFTFFLTVKQRPASPVQNVRE
jgi:hypothetical protein